MNRRDFLKSSGVAVAASSLAGCNNDAIDESKMKSNVKERKKSFSVNRKKIVNLTLATSWPAHFPIMGTGVDTFAKEAKEASGGTLNIKVYPKNSLIPALAVFDAASTGQIDMFHSGPYYWKGKNSAFSLFSGTPFGFTSEEINSWMLYGGGLELWRELYERYHLYPMMGGNTNVQMGGWFREPINSIDDLKGLKMRIPGLGGEVMAKLGVNPILLPAGEIYTALERGVIDATEWVGPALDIKMGFWRVAKYYYSGWHEPGSILELTFNKQSWLRLSDEHKMILNLAASKLNSSMSHEFHAQNADALKSLEKHKVNISYFPNDVVKAAKEAFSVVIEEQSRANSDFAKVWSESKSYLEKSRRWSNIGVRQYLNAR